MDNSFKNRLKDFIKLLLMIIFFCIILSITRIGCPIKFITGISCPGCGMTRAWIYLLHGDIHLAFYYHPLFFLVPIAFLVTFLNGKFISKYRNIILLLILLAFILVYIIRMVSGDNEIVTFHPSNNIINRILRNMRR
ncbi:DUF2752 domain-containing protein [Lachnospira sp.]|jgi:hypothetical protein|uniref:DUF2752 domain-containing protein n=1 Tax=Lachnospira sp. TaxID=2049031 RepID=UPI003FA5C747